MKIEVITGLVAAGLSLVLTGCGPPSPSPSPGPHSTTTITTTEGAANYGPSPVSYLEDTGIKGFAYSPDFLNDESCLHNPGSAKCLNLIDDDFYADWGENIWSDHGRGDVALMAGFGANAVRLYGNDPRFSKQKFLDQCQKSGLKVIAGISNYIYRQSSDACLPRGGNCYASMKAHYSSILKEGGFAKKGFYHRSIEFISMANELEQRGGAPNIIKGLVTAFDGILSAEKDANIQTWPDGKLPKFTVVWSLASNTGTCVDQMKRVFNAMRNPSSVGYTPQNSDLPEVFKNRWVNAFNGFNTAQEMMNYVSQAASAMPGYKIFIGEWTCEPRTDISPGCNEAQQTKQLTQLLGSDTQVLMGVNFYTLTQPYDQPGFDQQFGLYDMTADHPWNTGYITGDSKKSHPINCLKIKDFQGTKVVAGVYNGTVSTPECPGQVQVTV